MVRGRPKKTLKLLSVVVPSYKQEKTIKKDIKNIHTVLTKLVKRFELIVVVDGDLDTTTEILKKLHLRGLKIITFKKNQGKGYAVRKGMLSAKGNVIGFIDAGMDIHTNGFSMLLNHLDWYDADVIVGSKLHPVSKVSYPTYRRIISWGYRLLTATLFGFKVRDTQVGIKFFKRNVVEDVLPRLVVKKYAFDIEILAVAYRLGYTRIYEAPVEIDFRGAASITSRNLWRIVWLMLWDTAAVFYRLHILRFYDKKRKKRSILKRTQPQLASKYIT